MSPIKSFDKRRLDSLAKPRKVTEIFKDTGAKYSDPPNPIAKAALQYEASEYLQKLAIQWNRLKRTKYVPGAPSAEDIPAVEMYTNPYDIPRLLQKVKSVGIDKLKTPRNTRKKYVKDENAPKLFEISPNVLKHKISEYVKKLAVPREDLLKIQKVKMYKNPYPIPKHLKKMKSVGIEKLSTPQNPRKKYIDTIVPR